MIKGQDWSKYQSATPNLDGLDFGIVKVTEGLTYVNSLWARQRDHAKAAGLVWGAYHYPHMANDPLAEADFFLKQVAWKPGDIIVLDWEGYDAANVGVSNQRKIAYRDAWLKYVKSKMPNHKVGMYCNKSYWLDIDSTSNCGDFLWIATGGLPAGKPGITYKWTFHQYSTANNLDHDVADFPSRAALAEWAGLTTPPKEDPVTVSAADAKTLWKTDDFLAAGSTEKNTENKYWTPASFLTGTFENTVAILAQARTNGSTLTAIKSQVDATKAKVDSLATGGVDLDALATKVADLLAKRLQA